MKAEKITRNTLAAEAAERWAGTYGENCGANEGDILRNLRALGPAPSPDDVDAVIGNKSWTEVPGCDGCGETSPNAVVCVGQEPDFDSATAYLCGTCVLQAAAAITGGDA